LWNCRHYEESASPNAAPRRRGAGDLGSSPLEEARLPGTRGKRLYSCDRRSAGENPGFLAPAGRQNSPKTPLETKKNSLMLAYTPQIVQLEWRSCGADPDLQKVVLHVARDRGLKDTTELMQAVTGYLTDRGTMRLLAHVAEPAFYTQLRGFYVVAKQMLGTIPWDTVAVQKMLGKERFSWSGRSGQRTTPGCTSIVMDIINSLYNMAVYWSVRAATHTDNSDEIQKERQLSCFRSAFYLSKIAAYFAPPHSAALDKCTPPEITPMAIQGYRYFMEAQATELTVCRLIANLSDVILEEDMQDLFQTVLRYLNECGKRYHRAAQSFQPDSISKYIPFSISQNSILKAHFFPLYAHYLQMSYIVSRVQDADADMSGLLHSGFGEVADCRARLTRIMEDRAINRASPLFTTFNASLTAIETAATECENTLQGYADTFFIVRSDPPGGIIIGPLTDDEAKRVDFEERMREEHEFLPQVVGGPFLKLVPSTVQDLAEKIVNLVNEKIDAAIERRTRELHAKLDGFCISLGVSGLDEKIAEARACGARNPGQRQGEIGPFIRDGDPCSQLSVSQADLDKLEGAIAARDMKMEKIAELPIANRIEDCKRRFPDFIETIRLILRSIDEDYTNVLRADAERRATFGSVWDNEEFQRRTKENHARAKEESVRAEEGITAAQNLLRGLDVDGARISAALAACNIRDRIGVEGEEFDNAALCKDITALRVAMADAATKFYTAATTLQASMKLPSDLLEKLDRCREQGHKCISSGELALELNQAGYKTMGNAEIEKYAEDKAAGILSRISVLLEAICGEAKGHLGTLSAEHVNAYRAALPVFEAAEKAYQDRKAYYSRKREGVMATIAELTHLNDELEMVLEYDKQIVIGSTFFLDIKDELDRQKRDVMRQIDEYNVDAQERCNKLNTRGGRRA